MLTLGLVEDYFLNGLPVFFMKFLCFVICVRRISLALHLRRNITAHYVRDALSVEY